MLLEIESPIKVCGDFHGQFYDLLRLMKKSGGGPPFNRFLFLGDYVDRGKQSIETISLLLAYKLRYPEHIYMLRGNHECAKLTKTYGFFDECKRRYSIGLWGDFTYLFDCLPISAIIDERIFCVHGGLSPLTHHLSQVNDFHRPIEIPNQGLLTDMLWSDPTDTKGWKASDRGVSWLFGPDIIEKFCEKFDLDLICRAH